MPAPAIAEHAESRIIRTNRFDQDNRLLSELHLRLPFKSRRRGVVLKGRKSGRYRCRLHSGSVLQMRKYVLIKGDPVRRMRIAGQGKKHLRGQNIARVESRVNISQP